MWHTRAVVGVPALLCFRGGLTVMRLQLLLCVLHATYNAKQQGNYSVGGKNAVCEACPAGFTTVPGVSAEDADDCVCMPGGWGRGRD